jgi:multimeric flavodoxin WrbA
LKVIAFNGSPRKEWNTSTLLKQALEGAESEGAETELIHLYDLNFKGCESCFSCKQ